MRGDPFRSGVLSRSPRFARLAAARAISLVGDGVGILALVVHVQAVRGTGTAVALLLLVASLPRLLSPFTGVVADRVDQRKVLVTAELAQGVTMGIAAIWLPPLPVLLLLLLGKATAAAVAEPAGHSAVPLLVDDRDLPAANSVLGALRELGELAGPLLGGVLVAAAGVRAGLWVDAATFAVSAPMLLLLPPLACVRDKGADAGVGAAAREGLRFVASDPVTRAVTVAFVLVGLGAADDVALPFLALALDGGERAIGALYAAPAAGLLAGYLILARTGRRASTAAAYAAGITVVGLANAATGLSPVLAAAVAFQTVRGLGIALLETSLQTLLQRRVPRHLLGRVFANVYGAVNVAAAASLLAGGPILDATSPRTVLVGVGVVGLAGAAYAATRSRYSG